MKQKGQVKIFQSDTAAWFYIEIDRKNIPANAPRRGWNSIPVVVRLGKTKWETSIFPMGNNKKFIAIKASVRKAEKTHEGDFVEISFNINKEKIWK